MRCGTMTPTDDGASIGVASIIVQKQHSGLVGNTQPTGRQSGPGGH